MAGARRTKESHPSLMLTKGEWEFLVVGLVLGAMSMFGAILAIGYLIARGQ